MDVELSLNLVNLHFQILGVVFLIQTFVIWFYYSVNQNGKREVKDFADWISKWVVVWLGLLIPVLLAVFFSSAPHLAGFEVGYQASLCEKIQDSDWCKTVYNETLNRKYFSEFWNNEVPLILVPYFTSSFLYISETILLTRRLKENLGYSIFSKSFISGLVFIVITIFLRLFVPLNIYMFFLPLSLFVLLSIWVVIPYWKYFKKPERE